MSMIEYYKDISPVVGPEGQCQSVEMDPVNVSGISCNFTAHFLETPHRALSQTGSLHSPYRTLMKSSSSSRLAQQSTYSPCH